MLLLCMEIIGNSSRLLNGKGEVSRNTHGWIDLLFVTACGESDDFTSSSNMIYTLIR